MISRVKKTLKNPDKWAGVFVLLINNRITGINLKMTEQFTGITYYLKPRTTAKSAIAAITAAIIWPAK